MPRWPDPPIGLSPPCDYGGEDGGECEHRAFCSRTGSTCPRFSGWQTMQRGWAQRPREPYLLRRRSSARSAAASSTLRT